MPTTVYCDLYLYADDSMLQITGKDVNRYKKNLEEQVRKLRKVSKMEISCNN